MRDSSSSLPQVSVIVAAYNQERFIGRCLRSLLHQTFPKKSYEIIVIDDGSTDRTSYALSLFIDPSDSIVSCITLDANKGLPTALNLGINASRSRYIVRVDSDDFVNSNFLNFLHYYLETNPSAEAVACDYLVVDDAEVVSARLSSKEYPIACGIMFRKEKLLDIGLYDESFLRNEERDLRIRFEKKYQVDHLSLPLYRYRKHDHNITNDTNIMYEYQLKLQAKHGKSVE